MTSAPPPPDDDRSGNSFEESAQHLLEKVTGSSMVVAALTNVAVAKLHKINLFSRILGILPTFGALWI
jgi:hypothetical protein